MNLKMDEIAKGDYERENIQKWLTCLNYNLFQIICAASEKI